MCFEIFWFFVFQLLSVCTVICFAGILRHLAKFLLYDWILRADHMRVSRCRFPDVFWLRTHLENGKEFARIYSKNLEFAWSCLKEAFIGLKLGSTNKWVYLFSDLHDDSMWHVTQDQNCDNVTKRRNSPFSSSPTVVTNWFALVLGLLYHPDSWYMQQVPCHAKTNSLDFPTQCCWNLEKHPRFAEMWVAIWQAGVSCHIKLLECIAKGIKSLKFLVKMSVNIFSFYLAPTPSLLSSGFELAMGGGK